MDTSLIYNRQAHRDPFFIYYADQVPIETFEQYAVVILEPDFYQDVSMLNSETFAYLSIGEVHPTRAYFQKLQENALLLGTHQTYESHYLCLSDDLWLGHLLDTVIPEIIDKGFSGLMLDTVDALLMNHSREEVITFINTIKAGFPDLTLMQNRGLTIMDETEVDAFLLESTLSDLDTSGDFVMTEQINYRKDLTKRYFSVDYWDPNDHAGKEALYMRGLALGYIPLVTSRDLTQPPDLSHEHSYTPEMFDLGSNDVLQLSEVCE